ncbi:MAG TPA: FAD-dependent oxidoreductase [Spirochaetia bacterium]
MAVGVAALCVLLVLQSCESVDNRTKSGEETADVVIVGAGISGETAALELKAQDPRLNVILLEKQSRTGGSIRYASGYVGTSSKLSKKSFNTNTVDDVIAFLDDQIGKENVNHDYVRKLYDLSEYVTDNFITWGVDFDGTGATRAQDPHQERWTKDGRQIWYYCPAGNTNSIAKVLDVELAKQKVDVRLNSKVTDLIEVNGRVIGVKVDTTDRSYSIRAKAVILATGGFSSNGELVKRLTVGMYENVPTGPHPYTSNPGATGDVFSLVEKLGVPDIGTGVMAYQSSPGGGWIPSRFFVNQDGKRYMDEYSWGYNITFQTQKNKTACYRLLDTAVLNQQNDKTKAGVEAKVQAGTAAKFNTIDDLARGLGINAAQLKATIAAYNAAVDAGQSPEFGLPVDKATPIKTGPFYAERIAYITAGSLVSIRIDNDDRVVNANLQPVVGLYASGECTISNQFWGGLYAGSGFGVGSSAYGGVLAARTIVADLQKNSASK